MAKTLVVAALTGTIYEADMTKKPGVMKTNGRIDRTKECVSAVAEHMKLMADFNTEQPGFFQYVWEGIGTLTWQAEKDGESDG